MKVLMLLFSSMVLGVAGKASAQTGEIFGTVVDDNNDPLINAYIFADVGGALQGAAATNFDGNFSIKPLPIFSDSSDVLLEYTVCIESRECEIKSIGNLVFDSNKRLQLKLKLNLLPGLVRGPIYDEPLIFPKPAKPLIEPTMPGSRTVITGNDLERMPY